MLLPYWMSLSDEVMMLLLALAGPAGDLKNDAALHRRRLGCYVADYV